MTIDLNKEEAEIALTAIKASYFQGKAAAAAYELIKKLEVIANQK